ncbi:MAG: diguanylate cyclase [Legionella sp.]|nr:diguanylate cyclase [Legionella sp.]
MNKETLVKENKKLNSIIFTEKVILLNKYMSYGIPPHFICFLIVYVGLYKEVNQTTLFLWFITAVCTFIFHISVYMYNRANPFPPKYYLNFLIGLTILYGSFWAISGSILIPQNDLLYQMLVIIMNIGVASGGLQIFQLNMTSCILFTLLVLLPLSVWLLLQNTFIYLLIGIALLIYTCFQIFVSWMGNMNLNESLILRYENMDLVDSLVINNAILMESETRFRSAFDYAAIGKAIVSIEGKGLEVNRSLCQIVGYTEEELLKMDFQTLTYTEDLELDLKYVRKLLNNEINSYQMEKRYIHKNKNIIWILLSGSVVRDPNNQPLYFIAEIQNIDAQKKAEQELKYIAFHDVLTGLGNRKLLEESFNLAASYAQRHKKHIAILFMDLDHFKEINDTLGHDIGDLLLIEIASRLTSSVRASDVLSRLGGDEFIIILTDVINNAQIEPVAQKILDTIAKPIKIKNHKISVTASIGISTYPTDGQSFKKLLRQADTALYNAKSDGSKKIKFFIP